MDLRHCENRVTAVRIKDLKNTTDKINSGNIHKKKRVHKKKFNVSTFKILGFDITLTTSFFFTIHHFKRFNIQIKFRTIPHFPPHLKKLLPTDACIPVNRLGSMMSIFYFSLQSYDLYNKFQ